MNMINGGAVPEFQAVVLEVLDYNFIQQYAKVAKGAMQFETQWPAKLNGEVSMESKSGGTDPTKGGFSFKLKPKGQKGEQPSMEPVDADAAALGQEPARLDVKDLDAVTQNRPRMRGPGAKVAKEPEPDFDEKTLGRARRKPVA